MTRPSGIGVGLHHGFEVSGDVSTLGVQEKQLPNHRRNDLPDCIGTVNNDALLV